MSGKVNDDEVVLDMNVVDGEVVFLSLSVVSSVFGVLILCPITSKKALNIEKLFVRKVVVVTVVVVLIVVVVVCLLFRGFTVPAVSIVKNPSSVLSNLSFPARFFLAITVFRPFSFFNIP